MGLKQTAMASKLSAHCVVTLVHVMNRMRFHINFYRSVLGPIVDVVASFV